MSGNTKKQKNLTPAMRQYQRFKAEHPDAILLFRMGDFYETFYEDAQLCARELSITLTSRNKNDRHPIPLAGVPYHALEGYLAKLVRAGHKVAICEQVEDPKQAVGVVRRDVVRVVTPGTLTDEALLEESSENFLAAVHRQEETSALAWVELSTGRFYAQQIPTEELIDELVRLHPSEVLISEGWLTQKDCALKPLPQSIGCVLTAQESWQFDSANSMEKLTRHFSTTGMDGFGFEADDLALVPAGVVLHYLQETQKTALDHVHRLQQWNTDSHMRIDQTALRSLEIERTLRDGSRAGSLLGALDQTCTAMGARLLRQWICYPLTELDAIVARQDAIAELLQESSALNQSRDALSGLADIERINGRICTARATPRDLLALGETLAALPEISQAMNVCETPILRGLSQSLSQVQPLAERLLEALLEELPLTVREGGIFRNGYHAQLDRLRDISRDGQQWLAEFQAQESRRSGIQNLKVGFNKVFGYYLEVSNRDREKVPPEFVRKQTIKGAERYITDVLKKHEVEVLTAETRANELEYDLFDKLRSELATQSDLIQTVAAALATLDVLCNLAHLARQRRYCRPKITLEPELDVVDGKHPVLEQSLGQQFVPNDVKLSKAATRFLVLTGPNMAGKSTYIRQVALLALMAQTGSFIPAKAATVGITDRIFARVGASDELARGQSTFMVEMVETANILNNATDRSLVVLDEIGRGTSTFDGLALAWAISEHLAQHIRCRTMFATHYHELTELNDLLEGVGNANVAVREWKDQIVFLHTIAPGGTDKSYGIHVARLAGNPTTVITRAREVLERLQQDFSKEVNLSELSAKRDRSTSDDKQRTLFDQHYERVVANLREIDVNNLTPMEALQKLQKLQEQL